MKKRFLLVPLIALFVSGCVSANKPASYYQQYATKVDDFDDGYEEDTEAEENIVFDFDTTEISNVNDNQPNFSDSEKECLDVFENYSDLDELGRCGVAFANICKETMPTEERGAIGSVKPSGWHTVKYNGYVEGNYLYNRCHLIAFCLAGENANEKNLITGTRYMNVEGMLPYETMVLDYVNRSNNHVLYRVTPIFENDNLVASGVQIEAYSVEDNGSGICFNVFCPNIQPGIEIDYKTGDSQLISDYDGEYATSSSFSEESKSNITYLAPGQGEEKSISSKYVLNTNTKKIHLSTCSSVTDMSSKNLQETNSEIQELLNEGYAPCKNCNP